MEGEREIEVERDRETEREIESAREKQRERERDREREREIWLWVWALGWRSRLSSGVKACAIVACFGCRMCFFLEVCSTFAAYPWG